ncbi:MXAN_6652 family MXYO-CTERM-anchored protein [Archangium sp.]|jgi:uncharacterized protein (TIGR03382 family)|uniref:MXAN_6652 family MXYO-CTERM-anchored protein n=1 Tax=Archangium sp. TaxID=1872627 RepID=UPI002ED7EB02
MKFLSYGSAGVLAVSLLSSSAFANPAGAQGNSGKQGMTCTTCHTAGASVPTVEISGPATLNPGETGQYAFIIRGGPAKVGGTNIAVSNTEAVLAPATNSGLRPVGSGELTQTSPKAFNGTEVRFDFTLKAPASTGTVSIFAAGNSANGNATGSGAGASGDGIATTKLDVTVNAATTPGNDEDKGCSATGGAPMLGLALSALAMTRFRRRRS